MQAGFVLADDAALGGSDRCARWLGIGAEP
jgi:hypothetical protein